MPIDTTVKASDECKTIQTMKMLVDAAESDFQDAISCVRASVASDRRDYLIECSEEFMKCAVGKLRLCIQQSLLVPHAGVPPTYGKDLSPDASGQ